MIGKIKHYFNAYRRIQKTGECAGLLLARAELLRQENQLAASRLGRFEHKVYSQNGEDGIVSEIFNRIGETNRQCVEIGVEFGENNTMHLLNQGWSGLWLDSAIEEKDFPIPLRALADRGRLRARKAWIESGSLKPLLIEHGFGGEIDLLSVDLDFNTYAVWESVIDLKARVVVVEYNAALGKDRALRVKPDDKGAWDGSLYFGASLKSLEKLGGRHGYSLVGCDLTGVNAFFVRDDCLGDQFEGPFTSEFHFQPLRRGLQPHREYPVGFGEFLTD